MVEWLVPYIHGGCDRLKDGCDAMRRGWMKHKEAARPCHFSAAFCSRAADFHSGLEARISYVIARQDKR